MYLSVFAYFIAALALVMPDECNTLLEAATSKPSKIQILALFSVTLAKLGDSVEFVLPAVITQPVSCELGLSKRQENILALVLYLSMAAFSIVTIPFLRKLPRRLVILFSLYMSIIATVLCAVIPDYASLVVSRLVLGITLAVSMTPLSVYMSEISPDKKFYDMAAVIAAMGWSTGGGWCGILGYLFLERLGWRWFILLTSLPLFIPPIIAFQFILPETKRTDEHDNIEEVEGSHQGTKESTMVLRLVKLAFLCTFRTFTSLGSILLLPAIIKEDNIRNDRNNPCQAIHGAQFLTVSLVFGVCHFIGGGLGYVVHKCGVSAAVTFVVFSTINLAVFIIFQFSNTDAILSMLYLGVVHISLLAAATKADILTYDKFFFTESYLVISTAIRFAITYFVASIGNILPQVLYYTTVLKVHLATSVALLLASLSFFLKE